jgi:hypothetical protein
MQIHNPGWREELCISLICNGLELNMLSPQATSFLLRWVYPLNSFRLILISCLIVFSLLWLYSDWIYCFCLFSIVLTSTLNSYLFFLSVFFPFFIYDVFFFSLSHFLSFSFSVFVFRILVTRGWTVTCTVFSRPRPSFPCYPFISCFFTYDSFSKHCMCSLSFYVDVLD